MRKFCNEPVSVPVTWAMFPARLAWRLISALMALVVVSRCCLASDGLLFKQRSEQLVRVLKRAQGQHVRRVDLVQDGDFGIEARVVETANPVRGCSMLRLNSLRRCRGSSRWSPCALMFAPSASSTEAYWDFTRASSISIHA